MVSLQARDHVFDAEAYDYYARRSDWPCERVYRAVNTARIEVLLRRLGCLTPGRRLLDVGCGAGQLVHVACASGWTARGIDLSEPAVALATRCGANVERRDFFDDELTGARFDVIVMSEFIEHVSDPARFLMRASALLAPGGVLYVTTPNFGSVSRHLLGPDWSAVSEQHLCYFTPKTFRRLVEERTDLRIAAIETRNVNPEALDWFRKALRGRRRCRQPTKDVQTKNGAAPSTVPPTDRYAVRARIEASPSLRLLKRLGNVVLDMTRSGDALIAILRKSS